MNTVATPLLLLQDAAPLFGASLDTSCAPATAHVRVIRPSGATVDFVLHVGLVGDVVTVREATGTHLPSFCPDRHINSDRTFCLGWGPTAPSTVVDLTSAKEWWATVIRFLARQVIANERRRWINGPHDWAHGDAAAHQSRAETAAEALGPTFIRDLQQGTFAVAREHHRRGARIALTRGGKLVARIILSPRPRLKDNDVRCPCVENGGMPILHCQDHADQLVTFISEMWNWREQETAFGRRAALAGSRCCGTLERCSIRNALAEIATHKKKRDTHSRRHRPRRRPRF